jgi:hypothetical protein
VVRVTPDEPGVRPSEPISGELRARRGDLLLEAAELVGRFPALMATDLDAGVVAFYGPAQRSHRGVRPRDVCERVE